ncbi:survival factor 1 [Grosmannia clavigera kw1407]|uniref:Survival factor 1 n=1 Tax=Grosmannia clavigera (strain kw1407 / UAMH 11150) TaxID=655863 RepID=F0XFG2_GROCL|nr:survival factor 1 [Grosmannia clavigera kw1407]EFX04556.1 survival factor 1 [Grosmannia clavigera kw1407]
MFSWAKQTLAHVAGTQEPIYGSTAVKSVAGETKETPYTETTREHLKWTAMESTCVETQVFYFTSDSGPTAFVQVIYNNISGIRTTCQFNTKIFYPGETNKKTLWSSTPLRDHEFSEDMTSFYATDCAVELSEDGESYSIKSLNDDRAIVNLTVKRTAPGFQAGKTGRSLFGTDLDDPWGSMRHVFWPRCVASGSITTTEDGPLSFDGYRGLFIHALQGMKPHHLASRWNFANFQSKEYSAVLMEFTTPPSYGSTVITVGGIARDGEIIIAGTDQTTTHLAVKEDSENDWPEPTQIRFTWSGTAKDGSKVDAVVEGALEERLDRIDVMAEVPGFVKKIAGSVAGTKPYIYQYYPHKAPIALKLKQGDQTEITEPGRLFCEATFIS